MITLVWLETFKNKPYLWLCMVSLSRMKTTKSRRSIVHKKPDWWFYVSKMSSVSFILWNEDYCLNFVLQCAFRFWVLFFFIFGQSIIVIVIEWLTKFWSYQNICSSYTDKKKLYYLFSAKTSTSSHMIINSMNSF